MKTSKLIQKSRELARNYIVDNGRKFRLKLIDPGKDAFSAIRA